MAGKNKQSMIAIKNILAASLRLCVIFIFLSCKSTPQAYDITRETRLPLDTGASVYIIANARQARPVLDLLPLGEMNKQTRKMIDRTDFFAAALFPQESGRSFQLAAQGDYPGFRSRFGFRFSRNWKKQKSAEGNYWYSAANGLSIALNSEQAFVAASAYGSTVPFVKSKAAEIPQGFADFSQGSPLSLWFNDPASVIESLQSGSGLSFSFPVQQLFINIYPVSNDLCQAVIRMSFDNSSQARGMAAILSLAGNFLSDNFLSSLLFANPPIQNGNNLDIRTSRLGREDLEALFKMML